jgi:hypothetical protein
VALSDEWLGRFDQRFFRPMLKEILREIRVLSQQFSIGFVPC